MWATAIKRDLGDVWHKLGAGGNAACDKRVRLSSDAQEKQPQGVCLCKRCMRLHGIDLYEKAIAASDQASNTEIKARCETV
jgi:hypothetical protein